MVIVLLNGEVLVARLRLQADHCGCVPATKAQRASPRSTKLEEIPQVWAF